MADGIKAVALFATIAVVVVAIAWKRSNERRAEAERAAILRHRAIVRAKAGMPAGHPEELAPPSDFEDTWHGEFYDFVAAQLEDVKASETNQSGDQG
jgi:hypothetical protein